METAPTFPPIIPATLGFAKQTLSVDQQKKAGVEYIIGQRVCDFILKYKGLSFARANLATYPTIRPRCAG